MHFLQDARNTGGDLRQILTWAMAIAALVAICGVCETNAVRGDRCEGGGGGGVLCLQVYGRAHRSAIIVVLPLSGRRSTSASTDVYHYISLAHIARMSSVRRDPCEWEGLTTTLRLSASTIANYPRGRGGWQRSSSMLGRVRIRERALAELSLCAE
jgi:hypothetical protein